MIPNIKRSPEHHRKWPQNTELGVAQADLGVASKKIITHYIEFTRFSIFLIVGFKRNIEGIKVTRQREGLKPASSPWQGM